MSDVERLKAEWQALRDEESRLQVEATRLNDELRMITDRLRELNDNWGQWGLIRQACDKLKRAEAAERDATLPRVVWKREPKYGETRLVLVKATPKRLYVRRIGLPMCEQYDRSTGMRPGRPDNGFGGIIDVEKTIAQTQEGEKP